MPPASHLVQVPALRINATCFPPCTRKSELRPRRRRCRGSWRTASPAPGPWAPASCSPTRCGHAMVTWHGGAPARGPAHPARRHARAWQRPPRWWWCGVAGGRACWRPIALPRACLAAAVVVVAWRADTCCESFAHPATRRRPDRLHEAHTRCTCKVGVGRAPALDASVEPQVGRVGARREEERRVLEGHVREIAPLQPPRHHPRQRGDAVLRNGSHVARGGGGGGGGGAAGACIAGCC